MARLREAEAVIARLASSEAFAVARALDHARDEELIERLAFARKYLKEHPALSLPAPDGGSAAGAAPLLPITDRNMRQAIVAEWCLAAFGEGQASSLPQRGIRLLEEAVEAAQAAGCERGMAHMLVDFVFDRPAGTISQELGGVGVTALALANAAGLSADAEEAREVVRVLAKPLAHFTARNQVKNDAGFIALRQGAAVAERDGSGSEQRERVATPLPAPDTGWRTIDSAPKDISIDLWVAGWSDGPLRLPDCKWRESAWQTYSDKWGWMLVELNGCRATHWLPLPAPPVGDGSSPV